MNFYDILGEPHVKERQGNMAMQNEDFVTMMKPMMQDLLIH